MRYLIIGLGIYGGNLARDLVAQGNEVIGADTSRSTVDAIKDFITTAYVIDTTEESALSVLPLSNVDVVIVAIGENFGASIKTVALLKQAGVKRIYARAIDPLHEAIMSSFGIERILKPEQRAAADLTRELALGADVASLRVDSDVTVLRFRVPGWFVGVPYADIRLERDYNLQLLAVTRDHDSTNLLGIRDTESRIISTEGQNVDKSDTWVVMGTEKDYRAFYRRLINM